MKPSGLKVPSKINKLPASKSSGDGLQKDDYKIGDRVIVSGTKPGKIVFLGETQFQTGQWAGVELDKPEGKHDGSVQGIRYFQCEALHGVFLRPSKLAREKSDVRKSLSTSTFKQPVKMQLTAKNLALISEASPKRKPSNSRIPSPASSIRSMKYGTPSRKSYSVINSGLKKEDLKLGDRVATVGDKSKIGIVKFVGETQFAEGCWVGIELDEAIGKNDGSVAGQRYFECAPQHGLFAMVSKCTKLGPPVTGTRAKTKQIMRPSGAAQRNRNRSDAMSIASVTSSISTRKNPTKMKSEVSSRYKQKTAKTGVEAMHEVLDEKQQHIEQLLKERDIERGEMMELHQAMSTTKMDYESLKNENSRLRGSLEEEQKKIEEMSAKLEDMQFQMEESAIIKEEVESENSILKSRTKQLEGKTNESSDLSSGSTSEAKFEESNIEDRKKIKDLESKLTEETKIKQEKLSELNEVKSKFEILEKEHETLKHEKENVSFVKDEIESKLQSEIQQLKSQNQLLVKEKEQENVVMAELENKLKSSNDSQSENANKREQLQQSLSEYELKFKNVEENLKAVNEALKQTKTQNEELIKEKQKEVEARQSVEKKLSKQLRQSMSNSESKLQSRESELQEEIADLKNNHEHEKNQLDQQVTRLSEQILSLTKQHQESQQALHMMSQESDQHTEELVKQLRESRENENSLREELNQKQAILSEHDQFKNQIQLEFKKTLSHHEELQIEHEEALKRCDQLSRHVEDQKKYFFVSFLLVLVIREIIGAKAPASG